MWLDNPMPSTFVGRGPQLDALKDHFSHGGKLALIVGGPGSGKTSLAYMFGRCAESAGLFPGGCRLINVSRIVTVDDALVPPPSNPALLIIDDFDFASISFRESIATAMNQSPNLHAIICGRAIIPTDLRTTLMVQLSGLTREEFFQLIALRVAMKCKDQKYAQQLFDRFEGLPLYAELAGKSIRDFIVTFGEFISSLSDFRYSGILGPDGRPLADPSRSMRLAILDTNAAILEKLRSHPELLRNLPPRQFEEIVAELLSEQGYSVELTSFSKDGGFDISAAKKDGLGQFLFLVECKRYVPPNVVGVSIVRALHGVVQEKQANAGIIVTSSFFTRGAMEFQQRVPYQMQLHDYIALQKWLGIVGTKN